MLNVGITLIIGEGASLINVLLLKALVLKGILADSRRGAYFSAYSIIRNIRTILNYQINFWENCDGLYKTAWIMPTIGIGLLILIVCIWKKVEENKKKIILSLLILGRYILAFAPHIEYSGATVP